MKIKVGYIVILFIFIVGILFYNITLNSPIVFGDEGYYAYHAKMLSKNYILPKFEYLGTRILHRPFSKLPFFILLDTFAWFVDGEFGIKLLIPLFSILSAFMVYIFMKKFYNENAGLMAAFIFLLTPALITYSVLNYVDSLLGLLFVFGMYFGYKGLNNGKKRDLILAGIFGAFTILTKVTGLLLLALFLIYFIFSKKKNWKDLFMIFLVSILIVLPWFIRNVILFNNICLEREPFRCQDFFIDKEIQTIEGLNFAGGLPQVGTNVDVLKMGILNFSNFAFGFAITILLIFGIINILSKRIDKNIFLVLSVLIFVLIFVVGGGYRAEDTARFLVPAVIGISMVSGYLMDNIYNELKKYNKIIGIIVMLIILVFVFLYGLEKINTMPQVKQFSKAFFEACDWVKKDTPNDTLIFSIYSHQATYKCERISTATVPDKKEIQLTNNDTAYEHLKLHGFNYIFIQGFVVSQEPYEDSISIEFLNYIDSSPHFEKVFDNTNIYGNSGMLIYKVL
jgi:4-amino-4-deoxy-L-arabinose transferase-like glycosyltransferase